MTSAVRSPCSTSLCRRACRASGVQTRVNTCLLYTSFTTFAIASDADLKKSPVIILDAGHGGFDSGATSGSVVEKDINLQIALKLRDTLAFQGYTVIMTREQDTSTAVSYTHLPTESWMWAARWGGMAP